MMQGCLQLTLLQILMYICSRDAYQDQEEDQALSGLAAAVTLKSRGVTYKVSFTLHLHDASLLITLQPCILGVHNT